MPEEVKKESVLAILEQMNKKIEEGSVKSEELNKKIQELMEENKRLQYAADKGRTARYDDMHKEERKMEVKLREFNGKIVVGWKMIKNSVEKIDGIWREEQITELLFEDGSKEQVDLVVFERNFVYKTAVVENTTTSSKGGTEFDAVIKDSGKSIKINSTYVN